MNTQPQRTALLLVNRKARSGASDIESALDRLWAAGFDLVQPETKARQDLSDAVTSHADHVDCVIVGGGDGSLNSVADALHRTGKPLGILPLGTANDLARTLGIPPDPSAAAGIIVDGHQRRVDLGDVNGHPFFNVASIGFSVELARNLTSDAKKRLGAMGYAAAASKILGQSRPFAVEIEHDGVRERVTTVQISVGNGRYYGGGMAVESSAEPDDGKLDFYSLEVANWWELLLLAPALKRGTQGSHKNVRTFRTTELIVRTRRPHSINTDGELVTGTPAHFTVRPGAVSIFVPRVSG